MPMRRFLYLFKEWLHSPMSQESWSHLEKVLMWACVISIIVGAIVLIAHQIYVDYYVNDCLGFLRDR